MRVQERASANFAKASTSGEKDLRDAAQPYFDPTRPAAQKVSETVVRVTPYQP